MQYDDEKKFNVGELDGMGNYWYDLNKEPKYFSKKPFGGG